MTEPNPAASKRRKDLGQFFSGMAVGRLLAHLARADTARSIIDPTAGSGDLLQACLDAGANPRLLSGIEIEPRFAEEAKIRLPFAEIVNADLFEPTTLDALSASKFDLVIGNPPYVRYQTTTRTSHRATPDTPDVRANLVLWIARLPHLSPRAREILNDAASSYSGLADLAAPASLLSMALVAPKGRIALVLPQSWLTREYSRPIRAALHQLFDLEFLVEDQHASWFPDAQVKATLVVARRVERQGFAPTGDFARVQLGYRAGSAGSLVGVVAGGKESSEAIFAAALANGRSLPELEGIANFDRHSRASEAENAGLALKRDRSSAKTAASTVRLPQEIRTLIGSEAAAKLIRLDDLGVDVGQGLRTGANPFFYVTADKPGFVRLSPAMGGQRIRAAPQLIKPAVRDQREVGNSLFVRAGLARSFILDFRTQALPEDIQAAPWTVQTQYTPIPKEWADIVRAGSSLSLREDGPIVPELSAVSTNVRRLDDKLARFWYMLPDFQPRHLPDVFIGRVTGERVVAYRNIDRECLVDANFVTFRATGITPEALHAISNSDWFFANLELSAAVLGGGALKIEAANCRFVGLPPLSDAAHQRLSEIGGRLGSISPKDLGSLRGEIDELLLGELMPEHRIRGALESLRHIALAHSAARMMQSRY